MSFSFFNGSVATRLSATILAVGIIGCGAMTAFSLWRQSELIETALDRELHADYQSVAAAIDYEARMAKAIGITIAQLAPVQDAIVANDRDSLVRLLDPVLQTLKKELGVGLFTFSTPPATIFLRIHDPKAYGEDVSGRRKSILKANTERVAVSGVEPGRDTMSVFAPTPVAKGGQHIGVFDPGAAFGAKFVETAKQRFKADVSVLVPDGAGFKAMATTLAAGPALSSEDHQAGLKGQSTIRRLEIGGKPMAAIAGQILNFSGDPVAVLEVVKDISAYADLESKSRRDLFLTSFVVLLGAGLLGWASAGPIGRGLRRSTEALERLAKGDLAVEVTGADRGDELGTLARSLQVFRQNSIEMKRLAEEQEETKRRAEADKRAALNALAREFEENVGNVVTGLSETSVRMQSSSQQMSATAEETSRQSTTVAAAAEQAASNVQTVATAAEELSSSISEIGRQVSQSARIASKAVAEAKETDVKVQGLADAAQKIGEVVQLITDIAAQTNLLALNATIEAARAGEAGKGFAVVASEVKSLANQTAKATEEIGAQIASIQNATRDSVEAIKSIGTTIGEINEIATTIAAAVEEQGAATQEIARNVQQAASGTNEVTANIAGVNKAAAQTGSVAAEVLDASSELSKQSQRLQDQVGSFLKAIKTA